MITRRRYMGKHDTEYTIINYITGTMYYDTWVIPNANSRLRVKMARTALSSAQYNYQLWFGNGSNSSLCYRVYNNNSTTSVSFYCGRVYGGASGADQTLSYNQIYVFILEYGRASIDDGASYFSVSTSSGSWSLTSIKLGDTTEHQTNTLYSFQAYEDDELICELLPAIDRNGNYCMVNTITNELIYHSGGEITDAG